jgi:hypothetical protein
MHFSAFPRARDLDKDSKGKSNRFGAASTGRIPLQMM